MKATNIGKTILVWNQLSDVEIGELITVLKNIIKNYRTLNNDKVNNRPIPIALTQKNEYLCVLKKREEILVCSTKTITNTGENSYNYNFVINADSLYSSLYFLKDSFNYLQDHIRVLEKFPNTEWIKLPFNKAFEDYCLSPNINPENFIRNLERGTLSDMSKQFLRDVGFALEDSEFSEDLQKTITEANEIFFER